MSWMNGAVLTVRRSNAPLVRCSKFTKVASEAKEIIAAAIKRGAVGFRQAQCQKQHCKYDSQPGNIYCLHHLQMEKVTLPKNYEVTCKNCGTVFFATRLRSCFCKRQCLSQWHAKQPKVPVMKNCVKCNRFFKTSKKSRITCYRCSPTDPKRLIKGNLPPKVGDPTHPAP
jgi:hypothetical protein